MRAAAGLLPLLLALSAGCVDGGPRYDPTHPIQPVLTTHPAEGQGLVNVVHDPRIVGDDAGDAILCTTVYGHNNVPEVGFKWSNETQREQENRTHLHYDGGRAFPGNATEPDADGYNLSPDGSTFCARVPYADGAQRFVVAYGLEGPGGRGVISNETILPPR